MASIQLDAETIDTRSGRLALPPTSRVPAFTVLWHPETRRVGERAVLVDVAHGNGAELSRSTPRFGPPGAAPAEPLASGSVSRSPILIRRAEGVLLVCNDPAKLSIDGQRVRGAIRLSDDALAAGVVLELSSEVCLVLHWFTPRSPGPVPRDWVGDSDALHRVRERVMNAAPHDVSVLICGESGTGKELAAQALHQYSHRNKRRFVAVNMGSLGPEMAASALFGHKRGAFTGATADHLGYFDMADGGSLFLDEIGATPPEVQPLLLRALQTGEIQSLGASRPHRVDVRLVAATDVNLNQAVAAQRFQLALLHRLRGYEIQLPPLRQRREDIGILLRHCLARELASRGREHVLEARSDASPWLRAAQVAELARYDFPGNVRELENLARTLAIDWGGHQQVEADAVTRWCGPRAPSLVTSLTASDQVQADGSASAGSTLASTGMANSWASAAPAPSQSQQSQRPSEPSQEELMAALEAADFSPDGAADRLKVSRTTIYAWMRRFSLNIGRELDAKQIRSQLVLHAGDLAGAARELHVSERALRLRIDALKDASLSQLIRGRRS